MNMKRLGRLALVLMLCMVFSVGVVAEANAANLMSSPIFQACGITLGKSGTKISMSFTCTAKTTAATIGAPSYDIQQYVDGEWTNVKTGLSGSTANDRVSYSFGKTYTGVAGGKYRFIARFYIQTYAGDTGTATYTSASITL